MYRIARSLPETVINRDQMSVSVMCRGKPRGIAWAWRERIDPTRARVPNPGVMAFRVGDLAEKEMLLATNQGALFTESHYDGYPAVLVKLDTIELDLLELLMTNAWRYRAPKALVKNFGEENDESES